jgi:hypothetical protein
MGLALKCNVKSIGYVISVDDKPPECGSRFC